VDVARPPKKKTARNVGIIAGLVAVIAATVALSRLPKAAPSVEGATLLMDSVRQGDIVIDVRGPGTLVPERIRWITAQTSARVERLVAQSGQTVTSDMVLLEMSSQDQQIVTMQAEQQAREAQITLLNLKTNLQSQRLTQEGLVASTHTQFVNATQDAAAADSLLKLKLIPVFEANSKKALAEELTTRYRIEKQRLDLFNQTIDSQVAVSTAQVEQLKAIAHSQQARLSSLLVRAPEAGVLQDLTLQVGQWVPDGTTLAKVVQPGNLKAVLKIPESQAKDINIGQIASIDTRNGLIAGRVSRKDPSAIGGTVTVDVRLDGALPPGAVPDLSVDGTIQTSKLTNVIYTGRPASGAGTGPVGLFKIVNGGDEAIRVPVVLGKSSVNAVQVVSGLKPGDKVILSDMAQYDNVDRVRIK
jgi:HlyD family secretion protein